MIRIPMPSSSNWPSSFLSVPVLARALPAICEVYDGHRVSQTSAVGTGIESLRGAIGEFVERRHFYNEIELGERRTLNNMMDEQAQAAFARALGQTAGPTTPSLQNHRFYTTDVRNLYTFASLKVPSVFLSLTDKEADVDPEFLPFRDTTGCSAHVDFELALSGSLGELIERQCLLRFWLTKQATAEIHMDQAVRELRPDVSELINRLSDAGFLTFYDISLPDMPGYAVLAVFGACDESTPVQYSAGLSFGFSAQNALEKSVIELWQILVFMHYAVVCGYDGSKIEDYYHRHFWENNSLKSYRTMIDALPHDIVILANYLERPVGSHQGIMEFVRQITENVFFYMKRECIGRQTVWYVRVFSPDMFIHMNCLAPLNHDNEISASFQKTDAERRNRLVLFP